MFTDRCLLSFFGFLRNTKLFVLILKYINYFLIKNYLSLNYNIFLNYLKILKMI